MFMASVDKYTVYMDPMGYETTEIILTHERGKQTSHLSGRIVKTAAQQRTSGPVHMEIKKNKNSYMKKKDKK